jgi:hypothetical protein
MIHSAAVQMGFLRIRTSRKTERKASASCKRSGTKRRFCQSTVAEPSFEYEDLPGPATTPQELLRESTYYLPILHVVFRRL